MPSIQIKNVPEETHAVLRRRAAERHQLRQEYLRQHLIEEASEPSIDEIFNRIERGEDGRTGGSLPLKEAARLVRAQRDSR